MMNYKVLQQNFILDEKGYSSYGIEYSENGKTKYISDISTDYNAITEFADKLNRGDASPIHIHELVDDFISSL